MALNNLCRLSAQRLSIVSRCSSRSFGSITRLSTDDPRMSGAVVHGEMVYLSGQVAKDLDAPIKEQVETTLEKVDSLLQLAGSDKSKILTAQIWVKDMKDFGAMNAVWNQWIDPNNKPARACVEAPMATPKILFEVMVVATK